MERANTLINKLQEQANNGANAKQLLSIAQLLVTELSGIEMPEEIGKVSVWMPSVYFSGVAETVVAKETIVAETPEIPMVVEEVVVPVEIEPIKIIEKEKEVIVPVQPIEVTARRAAMVAVKPKEIYNFNVLVEEEEEPMPALVMHETKEVFELNDSIRTEARSFNDTLKQDTKEVAATLVDTPVKDLRKAIGINEKYLYINELFQGDENMYERSIKTINGFTVYPEAEHWIKRELHTKLFWIPDNQTVKQFDHLVRRRFA